MLDLSLIQSGLGPGYSSKSSNLFGFRERQ
jgi:hypothetical protein